MLQPLLQPQGGDGENFLAPLPPVRAVLGDEGVFPDGAGEGGVHCFQGEGGAADADGVSLLHGVASGRGKGVHPPPLKKQLVHINFADSQPSDKAVFRQQSPIFRHQVVPGKDQVGGGLPLPGVSVDVAAQQTGGLTRYQLAAVGRLARRLVGGGKIQDQGSPRPGQGDGGRLRSPQVLADLHPHHQIGHGLALPNQVIAQGDILSAQLHHGVQFSPRGKPAGLVELPVVGDVGLGDQSQQLSAAHHRCAVAELSVPSVPHRQAQGGEHVQVFSFL